MITELILSIVFLFLLILLANPLDFWMPSTAHMMLVVLLLVIFTVFAAFIFKERVRDEREALHRFIANRFAYLGGMAVLVIAIGIESFGHRLDMWLVWALVVMVLAKLFGLIYGRVRH